MSHFTLGVVNVGGGECRGGECRTIIIITRRWSPLSSALRSREADTWSVSRGRASVVGETDLGCDGDDCDDYGDYYGDYCDGYCGDHCGDYYGGENYDNNNYNDLFVHLCNWSSFWQLTTLKTLRSRPEDLELSKLLPLTLMVFSGVVFILGPLTAVLLALVMIMRKKNGNILEYQDKTEEKSFTRCKNLWGKRAWVLFNALINYTRKNQTHCRVWVAKFDWRWIHLRKHCICLRAPCNLHAFNHTNHINMILNLYFLIEPLKGCLRCIQSTSIFSHTTQSKR